MASGKKIVLIESYGELRIMNLRDFNAANMKHWRIVEAERVVGEQRTGELKTMSWRDYGFFKGSAGTKGWRIVEAIESINANIVYEDTNKNLANANKLRRGFLGLAHAYWGDYDRTKKITDTNAGNFNYGYSHITLKRDYEFYGKRDADRDFYPYYDRMIDLPPGVTKRSAIVAHKARFEQAAEFLRTRCKPAYDALMKDFALFEIRYDFN